MIIARARQPAVSRIVPNAGSGRVLVQGRGNLPASRRQLLKNPSFVNGIEDWTNAGAGSFFWDSSVQAYGHVSVLGGTGVDAARVLQLSVPATPGIIYRLGGIWRGDGTGGAARLAAFDGATELATTAAYGGAQPSAFEVTFTAGANTAVEWLISPTAAYQLALLAQASLIQV